MLHEVNDFVVFEEVVDGVEAYVGVDVEEASFHDFGFGLTDGAAECKELTVEIGRADGVAVDDCEFAYACACNEFSGVASDSSESYNEDVG